MRYIIDTNHLGLLINPRSDIRTRFLKRHQKGHQFCTIVPILCEVNAGLISERISPTSFQIMRRLAAFVRIWPLDPSICKIYGELFLSLRRKGRILSQVDLLLASMAMRYRLTILSSDRDFDSIIELKKENWLD